MAWIGPRHFQQLQTHYSPPAIISSSGNISVPELGGLNVFLMQERGLSGERERNHAGNHLPSSAHLHLHRGCTKHFTHCTLVYLSHQSCNSSPCLVSQLHTSFLGSSLPLVPLEVYLLPSVLGSNGAAEMYFRENCWCLTHYEDHHQWLLETENLLMGSNLSIFRHSIKTLNKNFRGSGQTMSHARPAKLIKIPESFLEASLINKGRRQQTTISLHEIILTTPQAGSWKTSLRCWSNPTK